MASCDLRLIAGGLAGAGRETEPAVLWGGGRVLAVGSEALAARARELDLRPWFLSPAPLDAHVHLYLGGVPADNLLASWRAGLAAVRDLGCKPGKPLPRAGREGCLLTASGPGLGVGWLAETPEGPTGYAKAAQQRLSEGAGVVKLFATGLLDYENPGRVNSPLSVSRAEAAAAVEVARRAGAAVAVHASGRETVRQMALAGVSSIEHGFFLEKDDFLFLKEQNVAWSPTIAPVLAHVADHQGRHTPETRDKWRFIAEGQGRALALAASLGVELLLGTDAGSYGLPHGQAIFREMEAWLAAGAEPGLVFAAATSRAAAHLGLAGQVGEITPGARAWFLACEQNPARSPLAWRRPRWRNF